MLDGSNGQGAGNQFPLNGISMSQDRRQKDLFRVQYISRENRENQQTDTRDERKKKLQAEIKRRKKMLDGDRLLELDRPTPSSQTNVETSLFANPPVMAPAIAVHKHSFSQESSLMDFKKKEIPVLSQRPIVDNDLLMKDNDSLSQRLLEKMVEQTIQSS